MQSDGNVVVYNDVYVDAWAVDTQECNGACPNVVFLLRIDDNCNLIRDTHNYDSSGSFQSSMTLFDGTSLTGHNWVVADR